MANAYPDRFAGAATVDYGCRAWLAFHGPVPPRAYELVAAVPVDLVGEHGFSEQELGEALVAAYYPIFDHPEIEDAVGRPDHQTGVISIVAQPSNPGADLDRLCDELRPTPPSNPAITIELALTLDLDSGKPTHSC